MFRHRRRIHGREYEYLEHSFRIGTKVRKISFYLPKRQEFSINEFIDLNKKLVEQVAQKRVKYLLGKVRYAKFFTYGDQLLTIERARIIFNLFYNQLPPAEQEHIKDEFLRRFLVNSMAMEGGTISYEVAKAIDENRRFNTKNINELDIPLYKQLRQAYHDLENMRLRYPLQIKRLHKTIYQGIYPFAGEFRTKDVTFGNLDQRAITADPAHIRTGYRQALTTYAKTKDQTLDFERIITFHQAYQGVHGFEDGNSRLGRLIMAEQFLRQGYPPPLIKGTQSRAYRTALVKAINNKNPTPLLKLFYTAYKRTVNKFWLPILETAIRQNFTKK